MPHEVVEVQTTPYEGQKPGTSGLRKKVTVFQQKNYVENFIQSFLDVYEPMPKVLVVGGDGRYYTHEVVKIILRMCAANGVERVVMGWNGILSTPAAAALITTIKADAGIILTASHNPGGPEGDFGIKINCSDGGPAPEKVMSAIYVATKSIKQFKTVLKPDFAIKIDNVSCFKINSMKVAVVDSVANYCEKISEVLELESFDKRWSGQRIKILVDCMNGVMGPYAIGVLTKRLGIPEISILRHKPLADFGGIHPDPNLTYAKDLVEMLKANPEIKFGVAFDGDGDRNMVLGEGAFFVSPGDALAVFLKNNKYIRYFAQKHYYYGSPKGVARSFPTSPAVDRVAKKLGIRHYATPTGWKYFGNLLKADMIGLCGEESFGLGSPHVYEKDGMWACIIWLQLITYTGKSVKQLVVELWEEFGRDYYCRYDYEDCDSSKCNEMMNEVDELFRSKSLIGKKYGSQEQYVVADTGNFEYRDPVDKSVTSNQGPYILFENEARIVVRLSGTGSQGSTVRLYISDYSKDNIMEESRVYLKELLDVAYTITRLPEFTGRSEPTVVT